MQIHGQAHLAIFQKTTMVLLDILALASTPVNVSFYSHSQLDRQADGKSVKVIRNAAGPTNYTLDVFCESKSRKREQVDGTVVVLRNNKVRPVSAPYIHHHRLTHILYVSYTSPRRILQPNSHCPNLKDQRSRTTSTDSSSNTTPTR